MDQASRDVSEKSESLSADRMMAPTLSKTMFWFVESIELKSPGFPSKTRLVMFTSSASGFNVLADYFRMF